VISEVVPVRDLFATLFFVSVGMVIDIRFMAQHWPVVLGAATFAFALKALATFIGVVRSSRCRISCRRAPRSSSCAP
jgi:CPA2 family monovalent cation:H+ antiporter-2